MTDATQALRDSSSLPALGALMLKWGRGGGGRGADFLFSAALSVRGYSQAPSPPACGSRGRIPELGHSSSPSHPAAFLTGTREAQSTMFGKDPGSSEDMEWVAVPLALTSVTDKRLLQ